MPQLFHLTLGITMLLCGIYCLAWLPKYKLRLTELQRAGRRTKDQVHMEIKRFKLIAGSSLLVGIGVICKFIFSL
jgi:hypothetical protein